VHVVEEAENGVIPEDSGNVATCDRRVYMKKKFLSVILSAAMLAGTLAGCGSASSGTAGSDATAGGSGAASGEKTKLKALFIAHPLTEDVTKMKWLQEMEDKAGVDVEWEVIRADWDTVKSTRFASGDIPDLVFNGTTDSDYTQYNGLFADLTQYINATDTPNIQAMFDEEPDTKILATTPEGQIYGLPKFQGKWPATNTVMFINKTWLDNLGLKVPTTYTEFENVLEQFKEKDANGNGDPNDEIPLDYNAYGGNDAFFNSAYSLTNLIGSLGIQTTDWGTDAYFAEDGKIRNYAVDERYKLFMKYIADLYSKGLIDENALTNDYSAFQSLSRGDESGNAVVGCVFGWEETDKFGNKLSSQYVPVPALDYDIDCAKGTYDTRWRNDYTGLNMSGNRVCISSKCKNIPAAMKFLDQFYDSTNSVQVLFGGITDKCVEKTGDNSFKVCDPLDSTVDAGTWKWTNAFADNGPMYIRRDTQIDMAPDMDNALKERETYADVLAKASESDTYPQMFMKYSADDLNTLAVTQANITSIIDNQWSLWMTGEQDIDSTWDAYVKSVQDAGLDTVLQIRQKAFDQYLQTMKTASAGSSASGSASTAASN
jgi:putative aldouronate transport system substrate-binding protein